MAHHFLCDKTGELPILNWEPSSQSVSEDAKVRAVGSWIAFSRVSVSKAPILARRYEINFGGANHYTRVHWTPPYSQSFPHLFVDCLLGLDVGRLGCTSRRPAAHFLRCRE